MTKSGNPMDIILEQLKNITQHIATIESSQEEMKNILKGYITDITEKVEEHDDRIAALESKVNALLNGDKMENDDWNKIIAEENERREKRVTLNDIVEETPKAVKTFSEVLKQNLQDDANKIFPRVKINSTRYKSDEEKILSKAKNIIGLKPISQGNISHFKNDGISTFEAEKMAAAEFLEHFLAMDSNTIQNIPILKTKINSKNNILYIETDPKVVTELFRKGGKAKTKEFSLVTFIPPQIFARYSAAQSMCKTLRENSTDQYTVRLGTRDVTVSTRKEGEVHWSSVSNALKDLPDWDFDRQWDGLSSVERTHYTEYSPPKTSRQSDLQTEYFTDEEEFEDKSLKRTITPPNNKEQPSAKKSR